MNQQEKAVARFFCIYCLSLIHISQIWGYYILHRICQNNQDPYGSLINKKIRKLGFYKARYGEIEYVDLKQVEEEKIEESIKKVQNYFDNMRNHSQEIEK